MHLFMLYGTQKSIFISADHKIDLNNVVILSRCVRFISSMQMLSKGLLHYMGYQAFNNRIIMMKLKL